MEHKIAIGIPLKNAVSIYEQAQYEQAQNNNMWLGFELDKNFCDAHNFNKTNKKPDGLWVQPYKNCIIGSSNTPSGELMKLAFEIKKKLKNIYEKQFNRRTKNWKSNLDA